MRKTSKVSIRAGLVKSEKALPFAPIGALARTIEGAS